MAIRTAAIAALLLAACAVDPNTPKGGIPQPGWTQIANAVNAVPSAAEYVDQNVRWIYDPNTPYGVHVSAGAPDPLTIHIDPGFPCTGPPCWETMTDRVWWLWHEIAHALVKPNPWADYGTTLAEKLGWEERMAMCAAEIWLQREVQGHQESTWYWHCPPEWKAALAVVLHQWGIPTP